MSTPYEAHRLRCVAAAEAWERAAETARLVGDFSRAYSCSQNAIRLRWLEEPDPDLEALFNAAAAPAVTLPAGLEEGDVIRIRAAGTVIPRE